MEMGKKNYLCGGKTNFFLQDRETLEKRMKLKYIVV